MTLLIFTLLTGLAIGQFVFLFTHTDFIVEYGVLFGLSRRLCKSEYEEWKVINKLDYGYHIFLREKFQNFWGRLIGCPFCLATFSSVVAAVLFTGFWFPITGLATAGIACLLFLSLSWFYKNTFS